MGKFFISMFCFVLLFGVVSAQDNKAGSTSGATTKEPETASFKDPFTKMEFVRVSAGCFQMGDVFGDGKQEERPVHEVCLDDFYIGKYEVTQKQWMEVMGANPSKFPDCGPQCPVEQVSWDDVSRFLDALNKKTGMKFRLPTEAEWEYAARSGGKNEKWQGGNDVSFADEYAWHYRNADKITHPAGQKKPNGLGLHDMNGNVWEWVEDIYDKAAYEKHPKKNPVLNAGQGERVVRGGSWGNLPQDVRNTLRLHDPQNYRYSNIGFRLAFSPERKPE